MSNTGMNRFLYMQRNDLLKNDVTWRGYDIDATVNAQSEPRYRYYISQALKSLGLSNVHAGEHGVSTFCALYEVEPRLGALTLARWWVWSRLAKGRKVRGAKTRAVEPDPSLAATTLPGDPAPAA